MVVSGFAIKVKMNLHEVIFPSLKGTWKKVNLNYHAIGMVTNQFNPLLILNVQKNFINEVHLYNRTDYSYGGYLEDRSTLWKGHYHDPDKMTHLGIDFNVPAGTDVYLPFLGALVFKTHDKDQHGGWGARCDFKHCDWTNHANDFYFILAHLDPDSISLEVDDNTFLGKGIKIGKVGDSDINGGWFPHLHLQCVSANEYEAHADPMEIDGYGGGNELKQKFPNPSVYCD